MPLNAPTWRRFQFRLRTLLLLMAVASVVLATEPWRVRSRRAALEGTAFTVADSGTISWHRRLLGDQAMKEVVLLEADREKLVRLELLFPEAVVRMACTAETELFLREVFAKYAPQASGAANGTAP